MHQLLRNQIDIRRVPFSDRGSRILVQQYPDSSRLFVKLAERLIGLEPGMEDYLKRPPLVEDLCLVDGSGAALDFEVTTSAELLEFQTALGCFQMAFQDENTLAFGLPPQTSCGLRFYTHTESYRSASRGAEIKAVRSLNYASNSKVMKNEYSMKQAGFSVEFIVQAAEDCTITLHVNAENGPARPPQPFSVTRANAERRWQTWFDRAPKVLEKYRQKYALAWWVMANNLISPHGFVRYEAMMPTKSLYVGIWLWDSAMHAIAMRHVDPDLARNQLRVMLAHQLPNGMLPDAIFDEGVVSEIDHPIHGTVTKPPILAWAALKIHQIDPGLDFLGEIYPALVRCAEWWLNENADAHGIVQYAHPYSSGLDNSPLWDYGMPVKSPDINTYLFIKVDCLAQIAEILGREAEAVAWRQKAALHLERMLKFLWDEKAGLFRAVHQEETIPAVTPFNLYPLWTGRLPAHMRERLIAHLKNPDEFWGSFMIPTVSREDPAYTLEAMWRGPIWANINYFFIEALQKVGESDMAADLRDVTLEMIGNEPGIREYYNPETGHAAESSAEMFGWTAAVYIDLAIQATAAAGGI